VLDIALGKYACEIGLESNMGTVIGSFLPTPWAAGRA